MNLESVGKKIDDIDVTISSRIIELFSAGLYSSPNKAFEELICNSYDAFASKVAVYSPDDPTVSNAYIWVCDNGEGLDAGELKQLWKIGESLKRKDKDRDKKRLQIGQFGIGKLSTYILARKLTYISKKDERYILATMDYNLINDDVNGIKIDEREVTEEEVKQIADEYIKSELLNFELFGEKASKTWTISLMTELKPKASEIKLGRLKWLLSTALPLNPGFELKFNGAEVESSKVKTPIMKKWIVGKEDETLDKIDGAISRVEKDADGEDKYFVDLQNLRGINGEFILYEDSLVDGKSSNLGRSHGIFLSIRGRLINLDDPLLGMEAFSHGAFNRTRIIINADELDDNLTSTREAVRDSIPFTQLKEYIKKKFNNEVRKYYFEQERKLDQEKSVSYRMAQTAYTTSKRPVYNFIQKYYEDKIINPLLIEKPDSDKKDELLNLYERDLETGEQVIEKIEYDYKQIEEPIAKLNLLTRTLSINKSHPYVANYIDSNNNPIPLESMVITEVLTESHLYELSLDESMVNEIIKRRDSTLRQLALSDKMGIPTAAMFLKDSLDNPSGLEEAVARVLTVFGFEVTPIGGNGEPDGKAEACLGFNEEGKNKSYSLTYDAKSTAKNKIAAATAHLSGLRRHRETYKADFSLEVAIDYQGSDDEMSAISVEAKNEKVTMMTAKDLIKLLLLITPKQIGLDKLRELFETCYAPQDVHQWIENVEKMEVEKPPYYELIDIVYELQKTDSEAPELSIIRYKLKEKMKKDYSKMQVREWLGLLSNLIPGSVTIDGDNVGVQASAQIIKERVHKAINDMPLGYQPLYDEIFK